MQNYQKKINLLQFKKKNPCLSKTENLIFKGFNAVQIELSAFFVHKDKMRFFKKKPIHTDSLNFASGNLTKFNKGTIHR